MPKKTRGIQVSPPRNKKRDREQAGKQPHEALHPAPDVHRDGLLGQEPLCWRRLSQWHWQVAKGKAENPFCLLKSHNLELYFNPQPQTLASLSRAAVLLVCIRWKGGKGGGGGGGGG